MKTKRVARNQKRLRLLHHHRQDDVVAVGYALGERILAMSTCVGHGSDRLLAEFKPDIV